MSRENRFLKRGGGRIFTERKEKWFHQPWINKLKYRHDENIAETNQSIKSERNIRLEQSWIFTFAMILMQGMLLF